MERLAAFSVVIGFLCFVSSLPAFAGAEHGLSIKVFTSLDDQFCVNSVIIERAHEVMLVDAQLTKTGAERVLQEIKETKKPLSIIYITHEHADHFLGLEVFKEAYPNVRIIANSSVVDRINKVIKQRSTNGKRSWAQAPPLTLLLSNNSTAPLLHSGAHKSRSSKTSKATPTKTQCFGFLDRES